MTKKPKRKVGRPTRREASRRALSDLDLSALDPVAILRTIAGDSSAPASARVAAAKALLIMDGQREKPPEDLSGGDAVSRQALRILQGGKK
jgi:hypothetical protein